MRRSLRASTYAPPPDPLKRDGAPDFGDLFGALPVAVLVIDPDGCVAHANAASELILNQSERSMRGVTLDALFGPPGGYEARRDGHAFAAFDSEIVTARGHRVHADFVAAPISDHPGWQAVTLHSSATSRRMGDSAGRASAARAAVGAAAMLAHEIKNPLSGIRGAAQLLSTNEGVDTELTTLITTEVDRVAALIDRMQDFTDTRPLALEPLNIYPLLGHVRRVAQAGFARDIVIEERFDPSLPPVLVDRDAFVQAVLNLLKNAAEAVIADGGGRIVLGTAFRHGMAVAAAPGRPRLPLPIEVTVTDSGPGAPAEIAQHLFDPFVSGKPEGQGLGLALVDKLVRAMGGIVQYTREGSPEASVFRLLLARAA
jgi:two-component system nitrogen regulation sensor histidine kinase GlnL